MSDSPGERKRNKRKVRKLLIRMIEARLQTRSCYWAWPWGHDWQTSGSGMVTTNSTDWKRVSKCEHCHKPYSWDSFDVWDLADFAEYYTEMDPEVVEDFRRMVRA